MAKNTLERKGYDYEYVVLEASSELIMELKDWTQQQTVPLIFEVDHRGTEKFIGGFDELQKQICKI
tara:strand:+ start:622 stop:819 length:198 start_codon:yes stop_codon:yes gene_type:complete